MRLLLDTSTFLWLMDMPEKLSAAAREACEDVRNELFLSVASVWEIQIKNRLGKLTLDVPLEEMVERQQTRNATRVLAIELAHAYALSELEDHHRDPFDRLLIAQARVEGAKLVTNDGDIAKYAVDVVW